MVDSKSTRRKTKKKSVSKRSGWERGLVWGGILVLLGFVFFEWRSKTNYDKSLAALENALRGTETGTERGISSSAIQSHICGFAFRHEEMADSQRKLKYRWPSMFKRYELALTINAEDRVTFVEGLGAAETKPAPRPSAPVLVVRQLPKEGRIKVGEHTVALTTREISPPNNGNGRGSLSRELIRQALLIAARDELGLPTLDASLGEVTPADESRQTFPFDLEVNVTSQLKQNVFIIELSRPNASGNWLSFSPPPIRIEGAYDAERLVEQVEAYSRKEFVEGLRQAGYEKWKGPATGSAPTSSKVSDSMDLVSQYAALRQICADRRAHGESDDNLGALIRTCANLGEMTDFHWSPASKVFKARSLLYAQRYLVKRSATASTLAHRAYARALAGLHARAIEDIDAAAALEKKEQPVWLKAIEAFCKYKPDVLLAVAGPEKELALNLRIRLSYPEIQGQEALEEINRFVEMNPASFRAQESLCAMNELTLKRAAIETGFDELWPHVYERLAEIPDLPLDVKKIAIQQSQSTDRTNPEREHKARVDLIARLRQKGLDEESEPSWTMLAELLSDASFMQVWRILDLQAHALAVSTSETVHQLFPLVKGHRLQRFVESFTGNSNADSAALRELLNSTDLSAYELQMLPLGGVLSRKGVDHLKFSNAAASHIDMLYGDQVLFRKINPYKKELSRTLRGISPHQPLPIAMAIEYDWDNVKELAGGWERTYAGNALVFEALAKHLPKPYGPDDADRFVKAIAQAPSNATYEKVAKEFEGRGDMDGYRKLLENALKLSDAGLEAARMQMFLAKLLMQRGDWKAARPHAIEAANSYSAWGLMTAAHCAEGMGDWSAAEAFHRAESERYENDSAEWYFWCLRSGKGNVKAARSCAQGYWQTFIPPLTPEKLYGSAVRYLVEGETAKARDAFVELVKGKQGDLINTTIVAILQDRLAQAADREVYFDMVISKPNMVSQLPELVNLFRVALKDPSDFRWNPRAFDDVVTRTPDNEVNLMYYCAGEFLRTHGQLEQSQEYLQTAATSFDVDAKSFLYANVALRQQKIAVGKARLNQFPDAVASIVRLLNRAEYERSAGRFEEAKKLLNEANQLRPDFTPTINESATLNESMRDYPAAIANYEEILRLNPESDRAHTNLAWLLATCELDEIRDGKNALKHAERAQELRMARNWRTERALAAAHAECGQFQKAIEFEERTYQDAPKDPADRRAMINTALQLESKARQKLYQSNQPFHRASKGN